MELSKMEHELNEIWANLTDTSKMKRIVKIVVMNPACTSEMVIPEPRDVYIIRMVLGYVAMKYMLEMASKAELEEHNV